jgi:surface polysaccharide O-acyltransferase-like enzyme
VYPKSGVVSLPVDLIRTVAMILVILLHASIENNPSIDIMSPQGIQLWWVSDIYNSLARTCVPLFIMLTGFLLLQPSKAEEPIRVFIKKRWKRIGIPVLFWAGAYFAWRFLINAETFSLTSIVQSIFVGPYFHFWYIYILIGLYLLTPVIRVLVAHADWNTIKYFFLLWFVGTGVVPLFTLYSGISAASSWFDQSVFVLTGMVGYFVLGAYVTRLQLRSSTLLLILVLSSLWTIIGTYFSAGILGNGYSQFFLEASSFNVIMASVTLFLLLATVSRQTIETRFSSGNRVLKVISENTLPIYLFHVMVLETLQKGYLGFKISVSTMNPIIEIPLITVITLVICLVVIVPLKKLPYMKRIIG